MIEPDVSVPIDEHRQRRGAGRARARRRAARVLVGVERVDDLAGEVREARRLVAEAVGVLRQAELAEDHDAVFTQLLRDAGVGRRERLAQRVVAVGGVHADDVDEVLQQDRQAVGGPAQLAGGALGVELRGVLQRVLVELRDGVEAGAALVQRLDAGDVGLRELHGRQLAAGHHLLRLQSGEGLEVEDGIGGGGRCLDGEQGRRGRRGRQQAPRGHGNAQGLLLRSDCSTTRSGCSAGGLPSPPAECAATLSAAPSAQPWPSGPTSPRENRRSVQRAGGLALHEMNG